MTPKAYVRLALCLLAGWFFGAGYLAGKQAADTWHARHHPPFVIMQVDANDSRACGHTIIIKDLEFSIPKE
jgi:hypothetical protein